MYLTSKKYKWIKLKSINSKKRQSIIKLKVYRSLFPSVQRGIGSVVIL